MSVLLAITTLSYTQMFMAIYKVNNTIIKKKIRKEI